MTGNVIIGSVQFDPEFPSTDFNLEFSDVVVRQMTYDDRTRWEAETTIVGIEPEEGELEWNKFHVRFEGGGEYHWWMLPDKEHKSTMTAVYYNETLPPDGDVSVGDTIKIKHIDRAFEGAVLKIQFHSKWVVIELPEHFIE